MSISIKTSLVLLLLALPFSSSWADDYQDTIKVFTNAGESGAFFKNAYGYAVFPTIGKGGIGIGGAHGTGQCGRQAGRRLSLPRGGAIGTRTAPSG